MRRVSLVSLFILLCVPRYLVAAVTDVKDIDDLSGIYEVTHATLNEKDCEKTGDPIEYASKFLRITSNKSAGYSVSICNGEDLDELDCVGGYQSTRLQEQLKSGWQGYRYSARKVKSADNTYSCQLFSSRRRIVVMGKNYIRYERTDWMETLSDFTVECEQPMAELYDQSQSLKCSTHIVTYGRRIVTSNDERAD